MKVSTKVAVPAHHSKRESRVSNIKHILLKKPSKLKFLKEVNYRRRAIHYRLLLPQTGKKRMPRLKVFVVYTDAQRTYLNDQIII